MKITVKKEDLQSIAEEITGVVNALGYIDDTDEIEDVWYYAERIRTQLFLLSRIIDAASSENGGTTA